MAGGTNHFAILDSKEHSGINYANVALGIDVFHGLHKPNNPHINGPGPLRSTTYGDGTMVVEPGVGLKPWISDDCAKTGIFVAAGSGALNLIKHGEDGAIRSTVSGIVPARCLNEGIVMVSGARVVRTGEKWNNRCFDRGYKRIPPRTLRQPVGSLRHAACVRRGLHAAYSALNRFLTSSEDSPCYAEPRGTVEEVD